TVSIDDTPVDLLAIDELRANIFAPPHDSALFSGSVADNVAAAAQPGADLARGGDSRGPSTRSRRHCPTA
ncbi:hypothetical protein GS982_19190, partial [Rhodococcus hoagii]|nr:hypothetical protein [Prescottella equi]